MRRIRPHHLYCMSLFSGGGYSDAFCENMTSVIAMVQKDEALLLAEGHDDICAACPNREEGGGCRLGTEDVAKRDAGTLAVLSLETGQSYSLKTLKERLQQAGEDGFDRVCNVCRWRELGYCSGKLLLERLQNGLLG